MILPSKINNFLEEEMQINWKFGILDRGNMISGYFLPRILFFNLILLRWLCQSLCLLKSQQMKSQTISLCLKPSIGGRSIGVWRDSMNLREFLTLSRPSYSHRHQHHQFHHHQQQQQWYHHHHHHYHRNHHNENSLHAEILFKEMLSWQMNYSVNQVLSIFIH